MQWIVNLCRRSVHLGEYFVVRVVIAIVQALPPSTCARLTIPLATLLYDVLKLRRDVVDENIRHAFPNYRAAQRVATAKAMWAHLLLMTAEIAHAPRKLHRTNWRHFSHIPELPRLVELLLSGRPVVMISGHFGNFELAGYLLALFGFPSHTIARPLENPFLDRFVKNFRGRTGQQMLAKDGSADAVGAVLREGGIVALLGDQYAGKRGCWVQFFGRPASTHKAVAVLSMASEAPLVVSYARRLNQPLHYELGLAGVADPRSGEFADCSVLNLAQWYTDCLERMIRRAPQQYWWLHRRWKGKPPVAVTKRLAARVA